jgi:hypothetical protein
VRLAALTLLAAFISCDTIVNPTQVVTTGGATPQPSAGAASAPVVPPRFDRVAVEIFQQLGCPSPPAGGGGSQIGVGCIARITATPTLNGATVPPELHGPSCAWFLDGARVTGSASSAVVYVTETSNPFNLVAHALAAGTFTLEAEVMGVRSGPRLFVMQ